MEIMRSLDNHVGSIKGIILFHRSFSKRKHIAFHDFLATFTCFSCFFISNRYVMQVIMGKLQLVICSLECGNKKNHQVTRYWLPLVSIMRKLKNLNAKFQNLDS